MGRGRQAGYRWPYRPTKPYRKEATGDVRIVIYLDEETYQQIDRAAQKSDCSLSSQACLFLEIGIETMAIEEAANG